MSARFFNRLLVVATSLSAALLLGASDLRAARGFSARALDETSVEAKSGTALPLQTPFRDENGVGTTLERALGGRPAVALFVDFSCRTMCGPMLALTAAALEQTGLRAGADFRLVAIGIDPGRSLAAARKMKSDVLAENAKLMAASEFLTGDEEAINAITAAAGYRFSYDSTHDQFAHPVAAFVVAPDGRIARAFAAPGLSGADLRLALVEAGQGRIGSMIDHVRLLCYGFDPIRGVYTAPVVLWLRIGGSAIVLALCAGLGFLAARGRRAGL
jgi:protein SCO1/2